MNYIVGRPFKSNLGSHLPGEEISEADARQWIRLETLLNTGRLYRVVGDDDYKHLPPRLAQAAIKHKRTQAKMEAKSSDLTAEKPVQVIEAEQFFDTEAAAREKLAEAQRKQVEKKSKAQKVKKDVNRPAEDFLPKKPVEEDTMKPVAEESGSDFDPETIRTMKLDELKDLAKERELPVSGNKPEIAQRIIDDFIAKREEKKKPEEAPEEE